MILSIKIYGVNYEDLNGKLIVFWLDSTHHEGRLHSPSELSTTAAMRESHFSERHYTYKDEEPECKFKIGRINTK